MKVADSSFLADFLRGREPAGRYRHDHPDEQFLAPAITLYELYLGALHEDRDPEAIDSSLPWVDSIDYTPGHALEGARVRRELAERGERLQHPDMMIAGVARSVGVPVVASDGYFERVDGLVVENPRAMYD